MNIAELSIRKSVITWVMTAVFVVGGLSAYSKLPRLEDPEFAIKEALVITPYPGASAEEVEREVTNLIEQALQEMGQLDRVESWSERGLSRVKAVMKDRYDMAALPQVWDELRRKVGDYQKRLPPGAGPSIVNDDFGDVYGVYLAITGEGYTQAEVYEFAKFLQRELLQATDVKRIGFYGVQKEGVYVEMRREKMAELGISPQAIYSALSSKNLVSSAGKINLGGEYIPVNPTGGFTSEKQFGDLLVGSRGPGSESLVYLRDVADVVRDYQTPPGNVLRFDREPAIGLVISTIPGGNVITMGESLEAKFKELESQIPLGMDLHVIALQTEAVKNAISGFAINLAEAVAIVVVVLLVFMGVRSGLIIGAILFITIAGSFIFLGMKNVTLERISLGALVIALGMLVDNAIVVTDSIRMKMQQGIDGIRASRETVAQTAVPLLGATVIAITAFAAIGTSQDSTGEYCRSLFTVILISLSMSWVTAVTITPLFCNTFLKVKEAGGKEEKDPYGGAFFRGYRAVLSLAIRARMVTAALVAGLFVLSLVGFGMVKQSFFPDSTRPQFYVDFFLPTGTHIDETTRRMEQAEEFLLQREGITHVATMVGGGQPRFLLTYTPEGAYSHFAQLMVDVDDYGIIPDMMAGLQTELEEMYPDAIVNVRRFVNGPSTGGKIQLRIYGPETEVLRSLAQRATDILRDEPDAKAVRDEWGSKVKVLRPRLAEAQARRAGIDRPQLAQAMEAAVEGTAVGVYREGDELLPIIARSPKKERVDFGNLGAVQVWSSAAGKMIPAGQVTTGFETVWEDPLIQRRNRMRMINIHTDPRRGLPSDLFRVVKPKIEKALGVDVPLLLGKDIGAGGDPYADLIASTIPVKWDDRLPLTGMPGYSMAWGGEAESSKKAQGAMSGTIPVFVALMILIVIFLFNSIKKTLIIWLTVPLCLIGVTAGLLLLDQPFGFMSLLGLLALSGMLIKNAIVLIDQIDTELAGGKDPFQAIVDSGVSRLIPVCMAALTTILGMLPLLKDAFFISMAVTIMFGLGFATVLTLIFVPVLYAFFYRIRYKG